MNTITFPPLVALQYCDSGLVRYGTHSHCLTKGKKWTWSYMYLQIMPWHMNILIRIYNIIWNPHLTGAWHTIKRDRLSNFIVHNECTSQLPNWRIIWSLMHFHRRRALLLIPAVCLSWVRIDTLRSVGGEKSKFKFTMNKYIVSWW